MTLDRDGVREENVDPFWERFSKKILHIGKGYDPKRVAIRIAGIYGLLGALWILLSDNILGMLESNPRLLTLLSVVKGWLYVLITGLIIYSLIYSTLRRIKIAEERIIQGFKELETAHEELTASQEKLRQQYDVLMENKRKLGVSEERLHHMAYHDMLTSLPNRLALYEDLSREFIETPEIREALLYIDLDNFKFINDSLGHFFGDQLIQSIGGRLVQVLKDKGTVYRHGGDEFVVYVHGHKGIEEVTGYALKILDSMKAPFKIGNSVFHTTMSIGTSLYPEHGSNPDELLKCADIALHKAKEAGKNRFVIFDQTMNEAVSERIVIEKQLRTALEKNEFEIHYQPQLDLKTGKISGFEALLRWHNLELGDISPVKFIKIAEDNHLIIEIGKWVLQKACCFLKKLHRNGYPDLTVSVNVSVLQLLQDNFVDEAIQALSLSGLEPELLELEITESVLMESFEMIDKNLIKLQQQGVRIALDDFGKGYSSLHYLLQLPINTLKVDKTFIDSIALGTKERTLTGQIVAFGKSIGLCVVAEGVETQEQLDYLIEYECHKIQGFLFSKPVPEKEVEALLARERPEEV